MATDLDELQARLALASDEIGLLNELCKEYVRANVKVQINRSSGGMRGPTVQVLANCEELVPVAIRVRAGNIAHELRSMLDSLACLLAIRNGKAPGRNTYFPISSSKAVFDVDGQKKIKLLSVGDQQRIGSLSPFKGGHQFLYPLHQADKMRKHQRLAASAANMAGVRVNGVGLFPPGAVVIGSRFNDQYIEELIVGDDNSDQSIVPGRQTVIAHMVGSGSPPIPEFRVVYDEPEEVKGWSVVGSLQHFSGAVAEVLALFA